jgi:Tfp pilus assembly protein PilX
MRLIVNRSLSILVARLRRLPAAEEGFTMIVAIGVFLVTSLLVAAAFVAAQSDIHLTQHDLDQKRALYAARAGVNEIIYQLNQNTNYWTGCPSQSKTAAPGTSVGEQYSFKPLPANGASACDTSSPIPTMIDTATGTFRMQVSGYAGNPQVSRTVVVGFRRNSPLDFLWYTDYETLDPNVYPDPTFAAANCKKWHREGRTDIQHNFTNYCGDIDWISGDQINGPMYTQDQYAICGAPVFGRDSNDKIESAAGTPLYAGCGSPGNNANVKGQLVANAPLIAPPPDNGQLLTDAGKYGTVYYGSTKIVLNGTQATVTQNGAPATPGTIDLTSKPIIYVRSNSGCSTRPLPVSCVVEMAKSRSPPSFNA